MESNKKPTKNVRVDNEDVDIIEMTLSSIKRVPQTTEKAEKTVFRKQTRRKLPPKKTMEFTHRRQRMKRFVEEVQDLPRPVIYRMKGLSTAELKEFHSKRSRVTRQIASHKIRQFHLEGENTKIEDVSEKSLAETIDSYLEESRKYMQKSTRFYDHMLATAVEYDQTVKMLHFGRTMKKHSSKQKRIKFQGSWWFCPKKYRTNKRPKGFFKEPMGRVFKISDDKLLFRNHGTFLDNQPSPIHKIYKELIARLMRRRTTNDIILDSSYFAREFFLVKSSISFRITRSSDIPYCFTPPTLRCGYFPNSATTRKSKKYYLAERFKEAQMEYLNLTFRKITPPKGFKSGTITSTELWNFHKIGKHLHGFFIVWTNGKAKRYLVDMFSHQHFPLFVKYKSWETRLKMAFDRVTAYNLNLAEIIRANRPVFDSLSQNPSFLKPITLGEIMCSMAEREMDQKYYMTSVGKQEFYDYGRGTTNEDYLSAFMIICGGTKVARPIWSYNLERHQVFKTNAMGSGVLTKAGKVFILNTPDKSNEFLIHLDDFELDVSSEMIHVRPLLSVEEANTTRIISDTPQKSVHPQKPKAKKAVRERRTRLTRMQMLKSRKAVVSVPVEKDPVEQQEVVKKRKKPGRKPKTLVSNANQTHDFETAYIASDIESEYEGYLSSEDISNELRRPKLKRSQSAESFLLDINYTDYYVNGLSLIHGQKIDFVDHPSAKTKRRKMKRRMMKHLGRYRQLQKTNHVYVELIHCHEGNFPNGKKAVANTKSAIRNGTYARHNLPEVYNKIWKQREVDAAFETLKDVIALIVEEELRETTIQISSAQFAQQCYTQRIEKIENLPATSSIRLPEPPYLAMEMLSGKKLSGRFNLEQERGKLKREVGMEVKKYESFSQCRKDYLFEMAMIERQKSAFHAHWKYLMERDAQLDRSLKMLKFDKLSIREFNLSEEERRLARLRSNKRVDIRMELVKANTPESKLELEQKEKEWKEEDLERKRKNAIEKRLASQARKEESTPSSQESIVLDFDLTSMNLSTANTCFR
ncbi:hypothetical protein GCK72_007644 [Caenorhabditis remanei]|uniref:Uncharacterized protein n=1 Tax=Caenorhabditis remanei TaxID=31234 RepID=A0A6A5HJL1_CAERE|nr:hypothetical protein GCK72_007644 [Caenorhabditis remanei]KAF1767685.1 hypothetical protein GCK72_007644 [Caenorhabditis remanei]